ncbi:hypothetical protein C0993_010105 [Termitomyces sp. T159_Od127]|nr:hypothetical protein C0993_010105 [Termitomyces sp. T159_Od127]
MGSPSDSESFLSPPNTTTLPRDKSNPPETTTSTTQSQTSNTIQQQDVIDRSVSPSRSAGGLDMDRFHMILNHLTPSQIQQLLSSIPNLDQMASPNPSDRTPSSQITQYTPPSDLFNQFLNPISNPQPVNASPTEGLLSFEDPQNHSQELNLPDDHLVNTGKQWMAIEDIERDVNASNTDIESLIRGLGLSLDNQNVEAGSAESSPRTSSPHLEADDTHPDPPPPLAPPGSTNAPSSVQNIHNDKVLLATPSLTGFDFESFINSFDSNMTPLDTPFSADETFNHLEQASVSRDPTKHLPPAQPLPLQQPISPYQQGAPIPGLRIVSGTTKRKSDASDLLIPPPTSVDGLEHPAINLTPPPAKPTKRRRNK